MIEYLKRWLKTKKDDLRNECATSLLQATEQKNIGEYVPAVDFKNLKAGDIVPLPNNTNLEDIFFIPNQEIKNKELTRQEKRRELINDVLKRQRHLRKNKLQKNKTNKISAITHEEVMSIASEISKDLKLKTKKMYEAYTKKKAVQNPIEEPAICPLKNRDLLKVKEALEDHNKVRGLGRFKISIWKEIKLLSKRYPYDTLVKELGLNGPSSKGKLKKIYGVTDQKTKNSIVHLWKNGLNKKQIMIELSIGNDTLNKTIEKGTNSKKVTNKNAKFNIAYK